MASAAQEISPTVTIASDKLSAQLVIPAGVDPAMLTGPLLKDIVRGQGIEVTDFTTQAIQSLTQNPPAGDQAVTVDIACAQPPVHGTDGSIQWLVGEEDQKNPERQDDPHTEQDTSQDADPLAVSHYDRSAYVMVETSDVIGRITPPSLCEDGRDVTGDTIPARPGKEVVLQLDETIMRRADGSLVAQQDGVLRREPGKAYISKQIEIKDYVDFSTGNLDFDGDISIGRGVRDCFTVKASGNVEVRGLIEAATIETGNDLIANGGFAGRERGYAKIGGSLRGRYLDNVQGHIKQDLCIDREVINCELTIDGGINSPHGSIIGGKIIPTGEVNIGTLGSGAGVETRLVIGSVPRLDPFVGELDAMVQTLTQDVEKLTAEQDMINKLSVKGRMTATDKERQTEIMFELSTTHTNLTKAQRTLDGVTREINGRRRVSITIQRMVNHGVVLICGQLRHKITTGFKGPARIYLEDGDRLVYRQGESPPCPLSQVADIQAIHPGKEAA
jgi:uncharacterized protein